MEFPTGFYVYLFLRKDGSPYYVGKGHGKRAFDKSRNWHPRDVSRIEIVESGLSEDAAFELEKRLVTKYGRKDLGMGILHNHTDGGEGTAGHILNEEQRRVRSFISQNQTEKTKAKISASLKGRKFSEKTLERMRNAAQLRSDEAYCTKMSEVKKATMTLETRERIGQALKGRKFSEESRERMRAAWKTRQRKEVLESWVVKRIQDGQQKYWDAAKRLQCPHCEKVVVERFYFKWHGDKCKKRSTTIS